MHIHKLKQVGLNPHFKSENIQREGKKETALFKYSYIPHAFPIPTSSLTLSLDDVFPAVVFTTISNGSLSSLASA